MYHFNNLTRYAGGIVASAALMACDSANLTQPGDRNTALLGDDARVHCAPTVVDLSGTRLLGHASARESTSTVEVSIPDGRYEIHLYYEDKLHSDPSQPDQTDEIWYLEGMNASGEYALITNHTDDLPKSETVGVTNVGPYDLVGIVAVSGRHASISPEYDSVIPNFNSIEPTMAKFYPHAGGCFDPI